MKPIFFLISLLVSISVSVRAHSQIELFGMSWGSDKGEIISILQSNGFVDERYTQIKTSYGAKERFFCVTKNENVSVGRAGGLGTCSYFHNECDNDGCYAVVGLTETFGGNDYLDFVFRKTDELYINTEEGIMNYFCKIFNGCEYSDEEITQFVLDNVGPRLEADETGYVSMNYDYEKGYCGRGDKGDEVCVKDQTITLYRGSYGTGGMTLSFN